MAKLSKAQRIAKKRLERLSKKELAKLVNTLGREAMSEKTRANHEAEYNARLLERCSAAEERVKRLASDLGADVRVIEIKAELERVLERERNYRESVRAELAEMDSLRATLRLRDARLNDAIADAARERQIRERLEATHH